MDIIAALAALPTAEPEVSAQAVTVDTEAFAAALQTAVSNVPAVPASLVAVTESAPPVANEPGMQPVPLPEIQAQVQPEVQPEVQPAPVQPELVGMELPEPEPEVLPEASLVLDDVAPRDDEPEQPKDALAEIRQRLDLIDSAGLMSLGALAVAPSVVAIQKPVAQPVEDSPAEGVQWSAPEVASTLVESAEPVEKPVRSTSSVAIDSPSDDAPQDTPAPTIAVQNLAPATLATVAAEEITSPVDSPQWQDDLGQQVVAMVRRGDQQVDMRLNPADLGPLSISLNMSEGGVQVQFQSAHASVRAAVEQALPQLQTVLAAQGLALGEASVNDGASRQTAGEQPRRESPRGEARREVAETAITPLPAQPIASSGAGVDLYL